MTSSRIYGDWRTTLPRYLRKQYPNPVTLTDDQLADITGSIDVRKASPYFPIDDNPIWSIRRYAAEAGYSVDYKSTDKRIKIFSPNVNSSALPQPSNGLESLASDSSRTTTQAIVSVTHKKNELN